MVLSRIFEWESFTAFGIPEVPEVANITARDLSSGLHGPHLNEGRGPSRDEITAVIPFASRAAAACSIPGKSTTAQGSTRPRVLIRISGPILALRGTMVPPSFHTARESMGIKGQFGSMVAIL